MAWGDGQVVKHIQWTEETIENELRQYRANKCCAEECRLDLEAARENITDNRDESIAAAVLQRAQGSDALHSSTVSDPTGRISFCLPDEADISRMSTEMMRLERRLRRVDAWMGALTNRERMIVRMFYIEGMVWGEVVFAYNANPTDGMGRDEKTVKRWRNEAIQRIKTVANSKMSPICP